MTPVLRRVVLPALRPGMTDVIVLGYLIETVVAEKIVTAVDLGQASTECVTTPTSSVACRK